MVSLLVGVVSEDDISRVLISSLHEIELLEAILKAVRVRGSADQVLYAPLDVACCSGNIAAIALLLRAGANPNRIAFLRKTILLHTATIQEHLEAVELLLKAGADPNFEYLNFARDTPLHLSARIGNAEIITLLLEYGANPTALNSDSYTPLHLSVGSNTVDATDVLLRHGANPNACESLSRTPLHFAVESTSHRTVDQIEALLAHGANPNAPDVIGLTPFHLAVKSGRLTTVEMLLQHAANVNTRHLSGYTPLHQAAGHGTLELVELLLKAGANPNAVDRDLNRTPLHCVSCRRSDQSAAIVEALILNGGNVNAKNWWGETPLHISARHSSYINNLLPLKALLALGAEIQSLDDGGKTPCDMDVEDETAIVLYEHWLSKVARFDAAMMGKYRSLLGLRSMYRHWRKTLAAKPPRLPPS